MSFVYNFFLLLWIRLVVNTYSLLQILYTILGLSRKECMVLANIQYPAIPKTKWVFNHIMLWTVSGYICPFHIYSTTLPAPTLAIWLQCKWLRYKYWISKQSTSVTATDSISAVSYTHLYLAVYNLKYFEETEFEHFKSWRIPFLSDVTRICQCGYCNYLIKFNHRALSCFISKNRTTNVPKFIYLLSYICLLYTSRCV